MLGFARNVLAVAEAYGSLLGGFTREFVAFKAKLHALGVCTVADFAKLVLSRNTANGSVWASVALHFGAFLAGNSANTNSHFNLLPVKKTVTSLI